MGKAPRRLVRVWSRIARDARLMRSVWLTALGAAAAPAAFADDISAASYGDPTGRYAHAVLGDAIEWGSLTLRHSGGETTIRLPDEAVFEDLRPRLADIDGDGDMEAITVESHARLGARLAVYDTTGLVAATPHIGTRFRWLAPAAWTDLDGDGRIEIAFVDRPHLAKTLRVWRLEDGALRQIATLPGVTNHRIGEAFISGGVRTCAGRTEIILATANWSDLTAITLTGDGLTATPLNTGAATQDAFADAMTCGNPEGYQPFQAN